MELTRDASVEPRFGWAEGVEPEGSREEDTGTENQEGEATEGECPTDSDEPRRAAAFTGGGRGLDYGLWNLRWVFDFAHVQSICRSFFFFWYYAMKKKMGRR